MIALQKIRDAQVFDAPFPFITIPDALPLPVYARVASLFDKPRSFMPLNRTGRVSPGYSVHRDIYMGFLALDLILAEMRLWTVGAALLEKFGKLPAKHDRYRDERLLIWDHPGYSLGPHTDSPSKVLSCLIYFADPGDNPALGTSLYTPVKKGFTCEGGPHYGFQNFNRVHTIAYRPNYLFAFPKSAVSFHGVEPEPEGERKLLLYDIRRA